MLMLGFILAPIMGEKRLGLGALMAAPYEDFFEDT